MGSRVNSLRQQSLFHLEKLLNPFLPPGLLAQADEGPNSRERIYSLRRTFFGFLFQVLKPDCSCREIVRQIQALFGLHQAGAVDESTSAYCQARARLPEDILIRLRHHLAEHLLKRTQRWFGFSVKVLDGTGISLPDTPKNQKAYPQPGGQKPGCGFPFLKIVGVFDLASGALLDYARGNKHKHELRLLYRLLHSFKPMDLVLADRGFSNYALLASLLLRGVGGLFRLHQSRPADFRKGKRLGKCDRLVVWKKPQLKPPYLSAAAWKLIPSELPLRMIRFSLAIKGYRVQSVTLITTLVDAKAYPAQELARLYARRWKIELWFRDIKTSMGMEVLRCQSPGMIHRELEMFLIAYNFIRCLMVKASTLHDAPIERISFKGTVDSVRQFSAAIAQAPSAKRQNHLIDLLLETIANDLVPDRPGRREPRALKRRPKPFQLLNKPRRKFKDSSHRNRYWKNNPRKSRP